jgi:hypothetical protein
MPGQRKQTMETRKSCILGEAYQGMRSLPKRVGDLYIHPFGRMMLPVGLWVGSWEWTSEAANSPVDTFSVLVSAISAVLMLYVQAAVGVMDVWW